VFVGGILLGATLTNAPRVERISVPAPQITVEVPPLQLPVPTVSVPVIAPEVTAREPAALPTPRPLSPQLWPQCVFAHGDVAGDVCQWDDGFPAIAASGKRVAMKYGEPDYTGDGESGLWIRFVDVTSGREVRTILVRAPGESIEDTGTNTAAVEKLQKKVAARIAEAQRVLDAGSYRTMTLLSSAGPFDGSADPDPAPPPTKIHADVDASGAVRVVDPATSKVIWQHQFGVASPKAPITEDDDGGTCPGWELRRMSLWWDPTTRVVLSNQEYRTGGCMCSDETVEQFAHVPPAA
jgi:hypothetical protein